MTITPAQRLRVARALFAGVAALCAFAIAQPDGTLPEWAKVLAGGVAAVLAAMSPELLGGGGS